MPLSLGGGMSGKGGGRLKMEKMQTIYNLGPLFLAFCKKKNKGVKGGKKNSNRGGREY